MNIEDYNKILQRYLQQNVVFKCENKVLKSGKIILFNIKQYFIRFSIESEKKSIKLLELPYPFLIQDSDKYCTLNYHITSFTGNNKLAKAALRNIDTGDSMRIFDKIVQILPLK